MRDLRWLRGWLLGASLAGAFAAAGCSTYSDDLQRGIRYYEDKDHREYERSLALFRALEPDVDSLKPEDQVRYFYYRGMTDYRLIAKDFDVAADARYWLGQAQAAEGFHAGSLTEEQNERLKETLDKLNRKVYGGADADADADAPEADAPKDKKAAKKKKGDDSDKAPSTKGDDASDSDKKPVKKKKKSSDDE